MLCIYNQTHNKCRYLYSNSTRNFVIKNKKFIMKFLFLNVKHQVDYFVSTLGDTQHILMIQNQEVSKWWPSNQTHRQVWFDPQGMVLLQLRKTLFLWKLEDLPSTPTGAPSDNGGCNSSCSCYKQHTALWCVTGASPCSYLISNLVH